MSEALCECCLPPVCSCCQRQEAVASKTVWYSRPKRNARTNVRLDIGLDVQMVDNQLPCKCKQCGECWDQPQHLPMEMSAWIKTIRKLKCPKCSANYKNISIPFGDGPPRISVA
jgi:hypothetical protein